MEKTVLGESNLKAPLIYLYYPFEAMKIKDIIEMGECLSTIKYIQSSDCDKKCYAYISYIADELKKSENIEACMEAMEAARKEIVDYLRCGGVASAPKDNPLYEFVGIFAENMCRQDTLYKNQGGYLGYTVQRIYSLSREEPMRGIPKQKVLTGKGENWYV